MADAPPSLGDFFAKKKKKVIKGSNLNNESASKPSEEKKPKPKDKDEDGWEEEQIAAPTMKVEMAGKLTRDDERKDEDDAVAPAWGAKKASKDQEEKRDERFDKRFPTLAKAVGASSNINLDHEPQVNIKTSKNAFSALDDRDDDDDDKPRRPKEIKPVLVHKQKGEREKEAIQREVDKYGGAAKKAGAGPEPKPKTGAESKSKKKDDDDDDDSEEAAAAKKKREKAAKEPAAKPEARKEDEDESAADGAWPKIEADPVAAKAKYRNRKTLPRKELPASELEEEKENRPQVGSKKPKKMFVDEEEDKGKKHILLDDDDFGRR